MKAQRITFGFALTIVVGGALLAILKVVHDTRISPENEKAILVAAVCVTVGVCLAIVGWSEG